MLKPLHILVHGELLNGPDLAAHLGSAGYDPRFELAPAHDSMTAAIHRMQVDAVLADPHSQNPNVVELLSLLRGVSPQVPLILISNDPPDGQSIEALRLGARDFVLNSDLLRLAEVLDRELKESPRQLDLTRRLLFETNWLPMWAFDLETLRFLEVNDAAVLSYGYSRAEFLSMTVMDIRSPEDVPRLKQAIAATSSEAQGKGSWWHRRKDGSKFPVEVVSQRTCLDGRPVALILAVDVSARFQQESRREEERRLASLVAETSVALSQMDSLQDCLQTCAEILCRNLDAALVRVWMVNHPEYVLELQASAGISAQLDGPDSIVPIGQRKIGRIASEATPYVTNDVPHDSWTGDPEWARREGITAFAGYPLKINDRVLGVIGAFSRHPFDGPALDILAAVGRSIAQFVERKRAENALRESEERVRLLIDSAAEGIFGIDLDGNCTLGNRAGIEMLGYASEAQLLGRNLHMLTHHTRADGSLYPSEECNIQHAFRSGEPTHSDTELLWRSDGTSFPAEYWAYPIRRNGSIDGAVLTFLDITERKRAEEDRRKLVLLLENSTDFISSASPTGELMYLNQCGARMIGLDHPEEAAGMHVSQFHPEAAWNKLATEALPTAIAVGHWQGESQLRNLKTGAVTDVLMSAFRVLRKETGELLCTAVIMRDVTERKLADAENRKLAMLVENCAEFIALASPDGKLIYVNPAGAALAGVPAATEILGQPISIFHTPAAWERITREVIPTAMKQGYWKGESQLRHFKTNAAIDVLMSAFAVRNPSGEVTSLTVVMLDITERKQAEISMRRAKEVAEAANRTKSEFLANMSHEIRTPMNGILGMTELALDTDLTFEQRDYLQTVKDSANTLLKLLNDILDFSKIEAGKMELDLSVFSLRSAVEDAVKLLSTMAHEKGLELTFAIARGVPEIVRGDVIRFCQILINLLGNAIKFTSAGSVALRLELADDSDSGQGVPLHVTVTDTGIGIPEDKREVIFKSFAQADGSMTRRFGGTGLGLAISSRLVELMGGRIWVESEVGRGSKFHFTAHLESAVREVLPV